MNVDNLQDREALRAECTEKIRRMKLELTEIYHVMSDIGASFSVLDYMENVQFKLDIMMHDVSTADIALGLEDTDHA